MRSMGEGHALVILTFWRGDTLNVPLHRLRRSPSPCRGGINKGWCLSRVSGEIDRRDRPQPALGRRWAYAWVPQSPSPSGEGLGWGI
jgi:hypothetical protein